MSLNERLFIVVPLISLLCNAFLFLTFLSAKKNRLIWAFLLMLATFTAWTAGSLFMRLSLFPSVRFWYEVSVTGIFCVPFLLYNFMYCYTSQKGTFARRLWGIVWLVIVVMNQFDLFIKHPQVRNTNGEMVFDFSMTPLVALPIVLAAITLFCAGRMAYRSIKRDGVPVSSFTPLFVGVIIMFCGTVADAIPGLGSLPNDTFVCGLNAICLYYTLYKKRLITLNHITSNSPTYLMAAAFTTLVLVATYHNIDAFFMRNFGAFATYKTIIFTVFFSLLTVVVYNIIKKLMNNLFIKGQVARDAELKKFSLAISKTLDLNEIAALYKNFIVDNVPSEIAYICVFDEASNRYQTIDCTQSMKAKTFSLPADNPLVAWLQKNNQAVLYRDFVRTSSYKSMWESEKNALRELGVELILPVMCDDILTGITFFAAKNKNKPFSYSEINFMESAAAILSIAFKNASLYATMQNEAQRDALTNLYNRRYFLKKAREDFELAKHDFFVLAIINFDDFALYNELYGVYEGDLILKYFAEILEETVQGRGMAARYGGKEFILSLPFCDTRTACSLIERIKTRLEGYLALSAEKTKRFLTFSAGVCAYPVSAASFEELTTYTNMAVYSAKKDGKNKTVVYTREQTERAAKNMESYNAKREIAENCAATIYALTAAIDAKDHYTFSHSNSVSDYAAALAQAIQLDPEHVEIVRQAGLLHDIGKIGIPESILCKPGRLTDEEFAVMKQHVEGSISMIRYLPSLDYVIPTAIGHHERWDGRGYPRGISGEDIPIGARCLCIADSFDAMVSRRPYKRPMSVDDALEEIERNLGKQFDPVLGKVFIQLVRTGRVTVRI